MGPHLKFDAESNDGIVETDYLVDDGAMAVVIAVWLVRCTMLVFNSYVGSVIVPRVYVALY